MEFYYHMYGETIGKLNILRKIENNDEVLFWSLDGEQGNLWQRGTIPFTSEMPYSVIIEGVSGGLFDG
jgi:hypothetical protein